MQTQPRGREAVFVKSAQTQVAYLFVGAKLSCVVHIHCWFCRGSFSGRKDIAVIGSSIIHGLNIYPRQLRDAGKRESHEHVVLKENQFSSSALRHGPHKRSPVF